MLDWIKYRLFRNDYGKRDVVSEKNQVNIEYSKTINVGDTLSPLIVHWMLDKKQIPDDKHIPKLRHLMAVGSVVGRGRFDVTLWGTGILKPSKAESIKKQSKYRRYDIRAVRGPQTRKVLIDAGYDCPDVYGDPAILMPFIYPASVEKKYQTSLILHHRTEIISEGKTDQEAYKLLIPKELVASGALHIINPKTADFRLFIDEIVSSERIISTSLHGIILAETYGVPTVFLNWGVADQLIKFKDWYESTDRTMDYASEFEEALKKNAMPLPMLSEMQQKLMAVFPYDLWS